jgi:hypothetical protein
MELDKNIIIKLEKLINTLELDYDQSNFLRNTMEIAYTTGYINGMNASKEIALKALKNNS